MGFLSLLLVLPAAEPDDGLAKKMLPIYLKEASEYSIAVASAPKEVLQLKKEPVFEWSNPVRSGVQQGVIFLWLRDGRPAALGNIYSQPEDRPSSPIPSAPGIEDNLAISIPSRRTGRGAIGSSTSFTRWTVTNSW